MIKAVVRFFETWNIMLTVVDTNGNQVNSVNPSIIEFNFSKNISFEGRILFCEDIIIMKALSEIYIFGCNFRFLDDVRDYPPLLYLSRNFGIKHLPTNGITKNYKVQCNNHLQMRLIAGRIIIFLLENFNYCGTYDKTSVRWNHECVLKL